MSDIDPDAVNEMLDTIEDLVDLECGTVDPDIFDHMFMSTYEDAMDLLVKYRPERWEPTPTGMRRRATEGQQ